MNVCTIAFLIYLTDPNLRMAPVLFCSFRRLFTYMYINIHTFTGDLLVDEPVLLAECILPELNVG